MQRIFLTAGFHGILIVASVIAPGCCSKDRASVTAVALSPWNQCEPEGIPYYLPKPLLVIAKNVRHIDEAKVGLTDPAPIPNGFDNQAAYADLKANVTVPGNGSTAIGATNAGEAGLTSVFDSTQSSLQTSPLTEKMTPSGRMEDGIAPDSFYTYQIIFVPDLSQKYGLRIKGGPGEIRAAMNLVNGWMYTGMGPYYLKDSSTAQNIMSFGVASMFAGRGAADVLNEVGDLARIAQGGDGGQENRALADPDTAALAQKFEILKKLMAMQNPCPQTILNYAEIHIYEPCLTLDGETNWRLVASHSFDRQYFNPQVDKDQMQMFLQMLNLGPGAPATNKPALPVIPADPRAPAGNDPQASNAQHGAPAIRTAFPQAPGPIIPGFQPPNTVAAAPPPTDTNQMSDRLFDDLERSKLGLAPSSNPTATTPATNINVHVEAGDRDIETRTHMPVGKSRPKNQSRTTRVRSLTPAMPTGPGGPGGSVGNTGSP